MKKIIPAEEAKNYICPMAVPTNPPVKDDNRCQGSQCMKWEDEVLPVMSKGSRNLPPLQVREIKTDKGYCGL